MCQGDGYDYLILLAVRLTPVEVAGPGEGSVAENTGIINQDV